MVQLEFSTMVILLATSEVGAKAGRVLLFTALHFPDDLPSGWKLLLEGRF